MCEHGGAKARRVYDRMLTSCVMPDNLSVTRPNFSGDCCASWKWSNAKIIIAVPDQ